MTKTFYIFALLFVLTNCRPKVGTCCGKTYTDIDDAIKCLSQTNDGNGTTADERLVLIAFIEKDLDAHQKLGWDIIKDPEIVKSAKRNYVLVITDVSHYKIPANERSSAMAECIKDNSDKTFFVIATQTQCCIDTWTLNDDKEFILERLGVGSGP